MGRMKDSMFENFGQRGGNLDLDEIAKKFGGEVVGPNKVSCPSPGCDPDDLSMLLIFNPGSNRPYIYASAGHIAEALRHVEKTIGGDMPAARKRPSSDEAIKIWEETSDCEGWQPETYLRERGITITIPEVLRYHGALTRGKSKSTFPAMVAGVSDVDDRIVAIHRTYLSHSGYAKANVDPAKMALGPIGGGAIRLAPVAEHLALAEGIETALSVMQESGVPTWSCISCNGLRQVVLPKEVRRVTICADGDDVGEQAALAAARRFTAEGRKVRIARAPKGMDFNDVLMAGLRK